MSKMHSISRLTIPARKNQVRALIFIVVIILILTMGLAAVAYLSRQETDITPQAQETARLRLMTYNIHGSIGDRETLKRTDQQIIDELKSVAAFIKQNQLDIAALQEVNRMPGIDDVQIISAELTRLGYPMHVTESVHKNSWNANSAFTALFHKSPSIATTTSARKNLPSTEGGSSPYFGSTASVLDTPFGRVRVFQHHPLPWISAPAGEELLAYADSFTDGIPAILIGDTNLFFDNPSHNLHGPVIAKFLEKYIKACDKNKFPNNHCHDTVIREENWEIDQILIDKRLQTTVVNAWVDTSRGNWPQEHSDHYPVLAELGPKILESIPNCSNLSGPTTLRVGSTGTYTATVYSPQQQLYGEIFRNNLTSIRFQSFGATNTATLQASWKPTAADIGTHTIHCRAWNGGIAECRPPSLVDGPPRYACAGPHYSLNVTVLPAVTPSPSSPPVPPTSPPTQQRFDVSLSANPLRGGTLSGGGQYQSGATVTVTAEPSSGYRFTGWYEGEVLLSAEMSYQFVVSRNRVLVARFVLISASNPTPHQLDLNGDGRVNIFDYSQLISEIGKTTATRSDINGDGIVNTIDFQIFVEGFPK